MTTTTHKTQLQLRISSEDKALIRQAADATGLDVSSFVLLHTKKAAEEVIAERRLFTLTDEEYDEFLARLNEPAKVLPGLQELAAKPSPFSDR